MIHPAQISEALTSFTQISLDEMNNVRLMNRTDTKYVMSPDRIPGLLVKMNGNYRILEISGKRAFLYHTTYLDTPDYLFFNQHITGKLSRNKVRFRKYETTGNTFIEVKMKTNKNRTVKWRMESSLAADGTYDHDTNEFIEKHIRHRPLILKPVLVSLFTRVTFVGVQTSERITLDYNISYSGPDGKKGSLPAVAVLEVKKNRFCDRSVITGILKESSFYPSGFSKYCIGHAVLNEHLRTNMLKPKLLMINKIKNEYNRHDLTR